MATHDDIQLRDFLQSLRDTGKIDNGEFNFALRLASKLETRSDTVVIPGAITLRKRVDSFSGLAAVATVWNTAELAENILSNLSVKDLANNVSLACHGFREYVQSSPHLRRELFLEPDNTYTISDPRCPKIQGVHYCVTPGYVECLVTKIQDMMEQLPRLHEVYIMQPPPKSLEVTYETDAGHVALGFVDNANGITYGFLWNAIKLHFKQWRRIRGAGLASMNLRVIEAHLMLRIPGGDCTQDP